MLLKVLLAATIGAGVLSAMPMSCIPNTLAQYITPGFTCVGADMVQYGNFTFSFIGTSGSSLLDPSTIQVTPLPDGFSFFSPFFNTLGGDVSVAVSLFGFDPPVVDVGTASFDPQLRTNGGGRASIVTNFLNNNQVPSNLNLIYDSTHSVTSDSAIIGPATSVQISNLIMLQGNGGNAGFNSFEEHIVPVTSPEPRAIALSVIGLAAIAIFRRSQTT